MRNPSANNAPWGWEAAMVIGWFICFLGLCFIACGSLAGLVSHAAGDEFVNDYNFFGPALLGVGVLVRWVSKFGLRLFHSSVEC